MAKIYFETYGCTLNHADTEHMAQLLKEADFEITENIKSSDIIIINSCAVKSPTENKILNRIEELKYRYEDKRIIVTGCIAQAYPEKIDDLTLLGTHNIDDIVDIVEELLEENIIRHLTQINNPQLLTKTYKKNKAIGIIPICRGCLGNCKYCIVKKTRGKLHSYSIENIIKKAKDQIRSGVREIWLTAQDTGCYGKDIGTNIIELLKNILSLEGKFMIRLGMMNPNFALEFKEKLLDIFKHKKMFKFIHLPVQSGSDSVLKNMNRKYTANEFIQLVTFLRLNIPDITIATDIIVGLPEEKDEDFEKTRELLRQTRPEVVNRSRYWKRDKTEAAKMKQIPGNITKDRSRLIEDLHRKIALMMNEKWMKWEGKVIVDEIGKEKSMLGRNFAYKQVAIPDSQDKLKIGDIVNVRVRKVTPHYLLGEIIENK